MYVVHVVPSKLQSREEEMSDHWVLFKIDVEDRVYNPELNPFEDGNARTIHTDHLETAGIVADRMAQNHPGCDVYIMQPAAIFSSVKPEVIRKNVTKEGVLPT